MFKDKFGQTIVKAESFQQLEISFDKIEDIVQAVLLYVPDREEGEHYHIPLNTQEAKVLRDWLDEFIQRKDESSSFYKPLESRFEEKEDGE